ncbi:UDP-N-acetylmuramate dehydrogenase [bacterium]|nr:UDP-N-acetylmuramate dehydrogenase [bacterium]
MSPLPENTIELFQLPGVSLLCDEPLAKHTTMGVGGAARFFLTIDEPPALEAAIAKLNRCGLPWMILGGGSNTIFGDGGWPGVMVALGKGFRKIERIPGKNRISAGAAAQLSAVMNFAKREGLAGLEWAAGVPGQLGGALAGNAGTPAGEICASLEAADVIDRNGIRKTFRHDEIQHGYRFSSLRDWIIVGATLELTPDSPDEIQKRIDAALAKRMEQPVGQRTSGCMFKNPPGNAAGRLIDQTGLKGLRIGGARVSEQHANFMINDGTATASDIEKLIAQVRETVEARHGIRLELEIKLIKP